MYYNSFFRDVHIYMVREYSAKPQGFAVLLYLKLQISTSEEAIEIARGSIWRSGLFMSPADSVSLEG